MVRHRWLQVLAAMVLLGGVVNCGAAAEASQLFPFVLPWDDASPGLTNLSGWLHRPAGKFGPVLSGPDGHFHAGAQRLRFFGVNLCFGAAFPTKEDADKIAARLARFGINVVRFHHMDSQPFPRGIRSRRGPGTGELDPEALDRLDYLTSRLKHHGIYTNLNLLVSRPFNQGDGLPAEIEQLDWKDRHIVGFFHEAALKLQKEYARKLLQHRNRYAQMAYAEDPAVAFVEINNEQGLIHAWLGGRVDRLPEVFQAELQRQWNDWLRQRYGSTPRLRQAWGIKEQPPGEELLANADFARKTERWHLEQHDGARASASIVEDLPEALHGKAARSVQLTVVQPSTTSWHVQFNQGGLAVKAEAPYTLSFWARADRPLTASVHLTQAHAPWQSLGFRQEIKLTTAWRSFRFTFLSQASDDNARIGISDLARQQASVWLAGVSFRPGGVVGLQAKERLEDASVPVLEHGRFGERTPTGERDWIRFLWDTENRYWQSMYRYLKDDLKVRGVVMGTIVGCSTPNLMAQLDAVDTHAYWQHPHFPGRPWDAENWIVNNRTMVNEAGGTLPGLAERRVAGKPHCVTEYNHPAPNTFSSEGFLLLAAYGALQDWDAIYTFAYGHDSRWNSRYIGGFFDISQHPTKMATLVPAVALFLRGDVQPARELISVALDREREIDQLRTARSWEMVHAGSVGVSARTALVHRVALVTEGSKQSTKPMKAAAKDSEVRLASDTGELVWDRVDHSRGVVTIDTPTSKAVIGYGGGKRFNLGGIVIEPGQTLQDGWSTVTLTAMEGNCTGGAARLLVTSTGIAENTGMTWKSPARDSVGRQWGKAPSLVEGIPVLLTLSISAGRVKAWALDECGQRRTVLPVEAVEQKAMINLGPQFRTLWYEVEIGAPLQR